MLRDCHSVAATMYHSQATDTVRIIMEKTAVEPRINIFGLLMTLELQITIIGYTGMQETFTTLLLLSTQSQEIELIHLNSLYLALSCGFNSITIITIKANVAALLVVMVVAIIGVVVIQPVVGGILIMEPFY